MRSMVRLSILGLVMGGGGLAAQDPNYVLEISDTTGVSPGALFQVSNTLDLTQAPGSVSGWSWGVCHDRTFAGVLGIEAGPDTLALNMGEGPGFNLVSIFDDGWTVGVVVNLLGGDREFVGGVFELHQATYRAYQAPPNPAGLELTYCGTLGQPLVSVILGLPGGGSINPTTVSGWVEFLPGPFFTRGDVNDDGVVDISDAVALVTTRFVAGADPPRCERAGDIDDDGAINGVVDTLYLLGSLFLGGPAVPPPSSPTTGECGADPTPDSLDCDGTLCP